MQVGDSPSGLPPAAARKDEVRPGGDTAPHAARSRSGQKFRDALERRQRGSAGGAGAQEAAASAAAMAGWFRSEAAGPTGKASPTTRTEAVASMAGARGVDRVLIGSGPEGAQARVRIGAGALAGTEIQLSSVSGGQAVEARLLTHAAGSRQTLSMVMDEIRSRLRDRGIVLSVRPSGTRAAAAASEAGAVGGERATPAGGSAGKGR